MLKIFYSLFLILQCFLTLTYALPLAPTDSFHPGSLSYEYGVEYVTTKIGKRKVEIYLPSGLTSDKKVPAIIFGHGQALNSSHYEKSFKHFAKKGIAVIFPQYDKGFFDMKWERMALDFNDLTKEVLKIYSDKIESSRIIYSGHSKGAYVGLMAAGARNFNNIAQSLVFFVPAGLDDSYLARLNPSIPLTLIWGEDDNIIKKELVTEVYNKAPSKFKQFIEVKSYPELKATHFFTVTKKTIFGGTDELSPYQFYGFFPWLMGAINDLERGELTNSYLYGDKALESGDPSIIHNVQRSW